MKYLQFINDLIFSVSNKVENDQSNQFNLVRKYLTEAVLSFCKNPISIVPVERGGMPFTSTITSLSSGARNVSLSTTDMKSYVDLTATSVNDLYNLLIDINQAADTIRNMNSNIERTTFDILLSMGDPSIIDDELSKGYGLSVYGVELGYNSNFLLGGLSSLSEFSIMGNGSPGNCYEVIKNGYVGDVWNNPSSLFDNNFDTIFCYEACKLDEHIRVSTNRVSTLASYIGDFYPSETGKLIQLSSLLGITNGYVNGTKYSDVDIQWSKDIDHHKVYDMNGKEITSMEINGLVLIIKGIVRLPSNADYMIVSGILSTSQQSIPEVLYVSINQGSIPLSFINTRLVNQDWGPDIYTIEINLSNIQDPVEDFTIHVIQRHAYNTTLGYPYLKGSFTATVSSTITDSVHADDVKFTKYLDHKFNLYGDRPDTNVASTLPNLSKKIEKSLDEILNLGTVDSKFAIDSTINDSNYSAGIIALAGRRWAINLSEVQLLSKTYVDKAVITTIPINVSDLETIAIEVDDFIPLNMEIRDNTPIKYYIKSGDKVFPIIPVNRGYVYDGSIRYNIGIGFDNYIEPVDGMVSIVIEISRLPGKNFAKNSPLVREIRVGEF